MSDKNKKIRKKPSADDRHENEAFPPVEGSGTARARFETSVTAAIKDRLVAGGVSRARVDDWAAKHLVVSLYGAHKPADPRD